MVMAFSMSGYPISTTLHMLETDVSLDIIHILRNVKCNAVFKKYSPSFSRAQYSDAWNAGFDSPTHNPFNPAYL